MRLGLLALGALFLLLAGCLAYSPSTTDPEVPSGPDPPGTNPPSQAASADGEPAQAEEDPAKGSEGDNNSSKPYLEESEMKMSQTGVSTGVVSTHENPISDLWDMEFGWCWQVEPDAVRVVVEWDPWYPFADVEFALVYPSEPEMVRGSSPLVWEHELSPEDQEDPCYTVWLEPDSDDVNVLLGEHFTLYFTWAFNGAELP